MARVEWTETYPQAYNYDDPEYIAWFKEFLKGFNERMVLAGMEYVSTTFDYDNFELPPVLTTTGVSTNSTIATFIYKFPTGTGVTEFELDASGDYYNIVSNSHDTTNAYIKFYFNFFKTNDYVTTLPRNQKEQLYCFYQLGSNVNESNPNNLDNTLTFYMQKYHYAGTGTAYYSGRYNYYDQTCLIYLDENVLNIRLFSGGYKVTGGGNYAPPSTGLLECYVYRENGHIVTWTYSLNNNSTVSSNTNKYAVNQYVLDFTYPNSMYYYTYSRWNDDCKITAYDNYSEIPVIQTDAILRKSSVDVSYVNIPNFVIVNQQHISANASGITTLVKYKGHLVKRTFFPFKSLYYNYMMVESNNSNSTIATFALYQGEYNQ